MGRRALVRQIVIAETETIIARGFEQAASEKATPVKPATVAAPVRGAASCADDGGECDMQPHEMTERDGDDHHEALPQ